MEITLAQFIQAAIAAFLVGFSKTGLPGAGIMIVPLMAAAFGAKPSVGVLLPMLFFGDFFGVGYHRRSADWRILVRLAPWVLAGIGVGYVALDSIGSADLKTIFGVLVLSLVALQFARQYGGTWLEEHLPRQWWFSATMGVLAGFTTMIGNVAGPIMGIYLLSMGLDKHAFMGTAAWFYMMVNAIKIPLNINLGLITPQTAFFDLKMTPIIIVGAIAGIFAFRVISQKWFNRIVLALAAAAALRLLIS